MTCAIARKQYSEPWQLEQIDAGRIAICPYLNSLVEAYSVDGAVVQDLGWPEPQAAAAAPHGPLPAQLAARHGAVSAAGPGWGGGPCTDVGGADDVVAGAGCGGAVIVCGCSQRGHLGTQQRDHWAPQGVCPWPSPGSVGLMAGSVALRGAPCWCGAGAGGTWGGP